ncbi:MAG: hypothetical protein KAX20_02125 [Candidatus Omnitrophica bacterium]|nr:hypothetical protein [Candidatus Omnitrophota bacterium]
MINWDKKFDYFVRWVFGAIYANQQIRKGCIEPNDREFKIKNFKWEHDGQWFEKLNVGENHPDGECNMATIILCCCAIELYGRILLGYGPAKKGKGAPQESFVAFIKNYFPKEYYKRAEAIYKRFRCGLVHSYVMGAIGYKRGFLLTRKGKKHSSEHLQYHNKRQLVINLDIFVKDLKEAFENYYSALKNKKKGTPNLQLIFDRDNKGKIRKTKTGKIKWKRDTINLAKNAKKVLRNFGI